MLTLIFHSDLFQAFFNVNFEPVIVKTYQFVNCERMPFFQEVGQGMSVSSCAGQKEMNMHFYHEGQNGLQSIVRIVRV